MRSLVKILVLAAALGGLTGAALADVSPPNALPDAVYADMMPFLRPGWDYPLVPRTDNDSTTGFAVIPATLPGDATETYWNISGSNQGEATNEANFEIHLNVDGNFAGSVEHGLLPPGVIYYGLNVGPIFVQAGRHSFTSRHDATDVVIESDEENNLFGRQFIWTPPVVEPGIVVSRPSPPLSDGGFEEVTEGLIHLNCDGLRMSTSDGWWHAMAVWADSDANDFDCRLHATSTGADNGFGTNLAYSASSYGNLDAVVVNKNFVPGTAWDVGVPSWFGEGSYKAYHASSTVMNFGDSETVAVGTDVPILLREFNLDSENIGPVSVTASGDPADGPLRLVVMEASFTYGTVGDGALVGGAWTDESGLARVSADLTVPGWYGIMVYRNQSDGLQARDVTIEVSTTPPDLAPWTPAGWHSAMVPRSALDGTEFSCPTPVLLNSDPDLTYFNLAAQNLGPVPSSIPTFTYLDGDERLGTTFLDRPAGAMVFTNYPTGAPLRPGRHVLSMRVDPYQEIEETDENNNVAGEQWIWNPHVFAPGDTDFRPYPPAATSGWEDVTSNELLFSNCDGLRLTGGTENYWRALAIRPWGVGDYDIRLHEASTGAKSGFGEALMGSYEVGPKTEYILVDFNTAGFADYDVGVLNDGDLSFEFWVHAGDAPLVSEEAIGEWGPFAIPANGLLDMTEFLIAPMGCTVTLENLSDADLGLAVHVAGTAYQNRTDAVAGSTTGGYGGDEEATFEVTSGQYYCIVVYREDMWSVDEAPYRLHITNGLSPVGDNDMPQATQIAGAYPNPFNPQTTVAFELARDDHARVLIYDLQGRLIRRLVDQALPVGRHTAVWEGRDDSGRSVASGIYFARLEAESGSGMTKLVLVK